MIDDFCITKNQYTAVRSFLISMNYMLIETTYTLIDELYDGHRFLSCWLVPVSGASQWKGLVLSIYVLTHARVENSMNQLQFKLASHVFIEVLAILGGQFANCEMDGSHNKTNWQASYINSYWYLSQKSKLRLKQIDILYFNSIQWVHLCRLVLMNHVLLHPSQLIVSNPSNGIPKLDKKIAVLNQE